MASRPLSVHEADRQGDHVILRLEGELAGQFWTEVIQDYLEDHYVDDGVKRIRIDLSSVSFIDSYGVATLIALYKESRQKKKHFSVEGAQGQVLEKLKTTGVRSVLEEGGGGAGSGGGSPA